MHFTADYLFVDILRCRVSIERCTMVELFAVESIPRFTIYFVIVERNRTRKTCKYRSVHVDFHLALTSIVVQFYSAHFCIVLISVSRFSRNKYAVQRISKVLLLLI